MTFYFDNDPLKGFDFDLDIQPNHPPKVQVDASMDSDSLWIDLDFKQFFEPPTALDQEVNQQPRPSKRRKVTSDQIKEIYPRGARAEQFLIKPDPLSKKRIRNSEASSEEQLDELQRLIEEGFEFEAGDLIETSQKPAKVSPHAANRRISHADPSKNRYESDVFFKYHQRKNFSRLAQDINSLVQCLWYLHETHFPRGSFDKNHFIDSIYKEAQTFFTPDCEKNDPRRIQVIKLINSLSRLKYAGSKKAVFNGGKRADYLSFLRAVNEAGYENFADDPERVVLPDNFDLSFLCMGATCSKN